MNYEPKKGKHQQSFTFECFVVYFLGARECEWEVLAIVLIDNTDVMLSCEEGAANGIACTVFCRHQAKWTTFIPLSCFLMEMVSCTL